MALRHDSIDDGNGGGRWLVFRLAIWGTAAAVAGIAMVGTTNSGVRLVAFMLVAVVATVLHISFRPSSDKSD